MIIGATCSTPVHLSRTPIGPPRVSLLVFAFARLFPAESAAGWRERTCIRLRFAFTFLPGWQLFMGAVLVPPSSACHREC